MADEACHIACASRTQEAISHCLEGDVSVLSPWLATMAFYKAVHVVEAVFANKGVGHSSSHEEREDGLKSQNRFQHIYRHYSVLKRASVNARYLSNCQVFDDYLPHKRVVDELLNDNLHQIEKSAAKLLSNPGALVLVKTT